MQVSPLVAKHQLMQLQTAACYIFMDVTDIGADLYVLISQKMVNVCANNPWTTFISNIEYSYNL